MNTCEQRIVQERYNNAQNTIRTQFSIRKEDRNLKAIEKARRVSETLKRWLNNK